MRGKRPRSLLVAVVAGRGTSVCDAVLVDHLWDTQDVIGCILWSYPQQAMWTLLGLANSSVLARKARVDKMINNIRRVKDEKRPLFDAGQYLFQDLIRVAKFQPPNNAKAYEVRS